MDIKDVSWEYKIVDCLAMAPDVPREEFYGISMLEHFNQLGIAGWELVSALPMETVPANPNTPTNQTFFIRHIFKRPFVLV
jgi:hypothetical protein